VPVVFVTVVLIVFPAIDAGSNQNVYVCFALKPPVDKNLSPIQLLRDGCNGAHSISNQFPVLRERDKYTDASLSNFGSHVSTTNTPGQ
jgi:hypothetical protein